MSREWQTTKSVMDARKQRKPNWSNDECLSLATLMAEYKHILRGKLGPSLTSEKKKTTWGLVTDRLNASFTGAQRTRDEVEKKWHNIFSQAKSEISAFKKEQSVTGGGPPSKPLSAVGEVVMSILGEDNACLGGVTGGIDSTLIQLQHSHPIDMPCMPPVAAPVPALQPLPSTSQIVDLTFLPAVPPPVTELFQTPHQPQPQTKAEIIEDLTIRKLQLQIAYNEMKLKKHNQEE